MPDLARAYGDTRRTMTDLVAELSDDELRATVPACPDWTVADLVAHVTAIPATLTDGSFPAGLNPAEFWNDEMAARRDAFVDDGVEARRGQPTAAVVQEWADVSDALEAMMRGDRPWPDGAPPMAEWILVTDLSVHHHDLRGALDEPGDRDSQATGLGLRSYVEGMRFRSAVQQLPPFTIVAGEREWLIGTGDPTAVVTADPFELARAASGRRSVEQVRSFAWEGDPDPVIVCFFPYGVRADALVE